MIAQMITVIAEKTNQGVSRIVPRVHRVQNRPQTVVDITDLAIVARFDFTGERGFDPFRPYRVVHPLQKIVRRVGFRIPRNRIGHVVRIVHAIVGNRRCTGGMRSDKRNETEVGASVVRGDLFHGAPGHKGLDRQFRGQGTGLRNVVHVRAFPVGLFDIVEFRVFTPEKGGVGVALVFFRRGLIFLGVHMHLVAEVLIGRARMELADAEGPVPQCLHPLSQIVATLELDVPVAGRGVAEEACFRRLAARPDVVARGHTSLDQTVHVRRVNPSVPERRDGVETLLVGHDEKDIGAITLHILQIIWSWEMRVYSSQLLYQS
jgi:hypothetical protein